MNLAVQVDVRGCFVAQLAARVITEKGGIITPMPEGRWWHVDEVGSGPRSVGQGLQEIFHSTSRGHAPVHPIGFQSHAGTFTYYRHSKISELGLKHWCQNSVRVGVGHSRAKDGAANENDCALRGFLVGLCLAKEVR